MIFPCDDPHSRVSRCSNKPKHHIIFDGYTVPKISQDPPKIKWVAFEEELSGRQPDGATPES